MTKRLPLVLNGGRVGELLPTDTLGIEMALSGTFVAGGYDPLRSAPSVSFNPGLTEVTFSTTQAIAEVVPKHAGGIRYIEVTFVGGASSGNAAVGVVGPTADLAHQIGYDGAADEVGMFQNTGRIYSGNTLTVTNGPFFDDGDVVGMAVNATTRRVWFRVNGGIWNGSGGNSPITGVGGVLIAGSGDIYAAVCSDDTATYRVNVGAVLAGAVSWGQTSPPGVITPQDVAITDPVQGQMLRYDNGAWTNFVLTASDIGAQPAAANLTEWAGISPSSKESAGAAAASLAAANAYTDAELSALAVSSGTWTPVLTNTTNVSASTANRGQWTKIGEVVTFSVRLAAQATSGSAGSPVVTILGVELPVAADLIGVSQAGGNATIGEAPYVTGQVSGDTTNDRLNITWYATSTSNRTITVTGTYRLNA